MNGQGIAYIDIEPLQAATLTDPHTAEIFGGQNIESVVVAVEELNLVDVPMGSSLHLEQKPDMLCLDGQLESNQFVEHTGGQQVLCLLFVGIGMQLVM